MIVGARFSKKRQKIVPKYEKIYKNVEDKNSFLINLATLFLFVI